LVRCWFDLIEMSRIYHVRYEGNNSTTGVTGSPTILIGFTFYESTPDQIRFFIGAHSRPDGVSGIFSADTLISGMSIPLDSNSYVITSTGTNMCTLNKLKGVYLPALNTLPAILWEWDNATGAPSISADNYNASQDDNYIRLYIPWAVTFLGTSYATGDVYLGSNTYITFGAGSIQWSGLTASNPNFPKIMIGAGDHSFQRVRASSGAIAVAPSLGNFDMTRTFGDSAFTITQPSSNSSGAFTYSVIGGTSVISISGTTVTIASAGTATVQASQAASGSYLAATKTATITINQATPSLTVSQSIFYQKFISGGTVSFNVISSNAGTVSRTHESNDPLVVTIPSSGSPSASIAGPGKTTIKVTQPATTNYTEVVNNALITIVVVGQGKTYTSETFPSSFDLSGTNLSGSVFTSCNLTGADLYNTTVNASTSFSTSTLNSLKSGRITGVTSLLPVGFTMI
jgi:hypothetical protein